MSLLTAIQGYLSGYPGMRPVRMLTDQVDKSAESYAVAPTGNLRIEEDIIGNRTYENDYVFLARECTADEAGRRDNQDFLEGLYDWLEDSPPPELPGDYEAEALTPSNAVLMDVDDDGTGIYQIQIKLRFTKRRED